MFIREYQTFACKERIELFYNTVHTVNGKDYTKEQLDVWATRQADIENGINRFKNINCSRFYYGEIVL